MSCSLQASMSNTNSRSSPKLMSIESVMPSNHLILCRPLLLLPSIFPGIRVFSKELAFRIRWPKYWSFSFNIRPSSEHPGLISFRMDWLHLLAVQGTFKSLLQHHGSKASILLHSAFFIVQLSYPYMTTGKTIALNRQTFVDKVMSLLFNILSSLVITFLPRSKCLDFMAAITICSDFGAPKNKVSHCFHCFPIYLPWSDETILFLWRTLTNRAKSNVHYWLENNKNSMAEMITIHQMFISSFTFPSAHESKWFMYMTISTVKMEKGS